MSDDRQTLLQAWIDARNEVDRSIFLSASAGVGFCATMLFNVDKPVEWLFASFLGAALVLFAFTAALTLFVFRANAAFLERLMCDGASSNRDSTIEIREQLALLFFVLAIVCIGASVLIHLV